MLVDDLLRVTVKAEADAWNLIETADLFAPLPPFPWLMRAIQLAPGRITLLAGYPDVGKTVIAMTLAMAIASGRPLWGLFTPERTGIVLHLNAEIGSYLAKERYQRIARGMAVDVGALIERRALRFSNYPTPRLDDSSFESGLKTLCAGVSLVVLDSLRAFSGGLDENAKEIGVALLMLARVSEATGATIVVLHHTRKPSKDDVGGIKMAISGSGSILGAADCAYVFEASDGHVKAHHERSPVGRPLDLFGLRFEDVEGNGDPRWGLRVVHLDAEQIAEGKRRADDEARARSLSAATDRVLEVLRHHAGVVRVGREDFRALCGMGADPFRRALADLVARGIVVEQGTYHRKEWRLDESRPSGLIQTA